MKQVTVNLAERSYSVQIEAGLLSRLGELTRACAPHRRALLAVDQAIASTHGEMARAALEGAGFATTTHELVAKESAKTLETARAMYEAMLATRLERGSPVVALGGGIVGDVAGFVASTYLRGVPVVQVPTTLLGMVDASVGGKTGVNHPLPDGSLGKNLIGAFWQPVVVLADPDTLKTLEARDFRCGLAECVKHGMIADADLITWLETNAEAILALDVAALSTLIERCVAIKARVVEADEHEGGRRALLNLGHTFAHAIESIEEHDFRHGEAVAIGLNAATIIANRSGRLDDDSVARVVTLLKRLGLPTTLPPTSLDRLEMAMGFDKKVSDGTTRLILPRGLGEAEIVDDVPPAEIRAAWREVMPG